MHVAHVAAAIQAVALGVTQLAFFKQNFADILENIEGWVAGWPGAGDGGDV